RFGIASLKARVKAARSASLRKRTSAQVAVIEMQRMSAGDNRLSVEQPVPGVVRAEERQRHQTLPGKQSAQDERAKQPPPGAVGHWWIRASMQIAFHGPAMVTGVRYSHKACLKLAEIGLIWPPCAPRAARARRLIRRKSPLLDSVPPPVRMAQDPATEQEITGAAAMKCQKCAKAATLHITEVISEEQFEELHLCEECAHKYLYEPNKIGSPKGGESGSLVESEEPGLLNRECPVCGIKFVEFR